MAVFFLDCWWFVLLALLAAPTLAGWPGLNWFLNFNPAGLNSGEVGVERPEIYG